CSSYGRSPDLHSFPTRRSSDLRPFWIVLKVNKALPANLLISETSNFPPSSSSNSSNHDSHSFLFSSASAKPISRSSNAPTVTSRSEEHTSELQSRFDLVCRLLL